MYTPRMRHLYVVLLTQQQLHAYKATGENDPTVSAKWCNQNIHGVVL